MGTTPDLRWESLRRMLETKPLVRFLDLHNGLSGLIIENIGVGAPAGRQEFDGMWASSLTDAASKGKSDIGAVNTSSRIATINEALEVTSKIIIYDGDTGGTPEHFVFTVRTLKPLGFSAVTLEDKTGLKKNSLFGVDANQTLESIDIFYDKIRIGKEAQQTEKFMILRP